MHAWDNFVMILGGGLAPLLPSSGCSGASLHSSRRCGSAASLFMTAKP